MGGCGRGADPVSDQHVGGQMWHAVAPLGLGHAGRPVHVLAADYRPHQLGLIVQLGGEQRGPG